MAPTTTPSPDLAGKHILFTAPRFFAYEREIVSELRRRGAIVDFFADRPFDSPILHALARFSRKAILPLTERFIRRKLAEFGDKRYDHVFVINGQTLPYDLLAELRQANPEARFTFYLWDSMKNRKNALELLPLFDRASCFEPDDARRNGIKFRPLFFSPAFAQDSGEAIVYDVSFIGTAHTDRYAVVSRVNAALAPDLRRFWFLYLQARWVFAAYRVMNKTMRGASIDQFRFKPLTRQESSRIFWQSHAILDVEHPRQTGLTMRTLETLGARKKLITTNAGVRDYLLYDPANICIVDRNDPKIPADFLTSPVKPLGDELYHRYSIAGWIDEILGDDAADDNAVPSHLRSA